MAEVFFEKAGIAIGLAKRRSWVSVFIRIAPSLAPASANLSSSVLRRSSDFVVAGGLFFGEVEVKNLFDLFGGVPGRLPFYCVAGGRGRLL